MVIALASLIGCAAAVPSRTHAAPVSAASRLYSPDGQRFAYVRQSAQASAGRGTLPRAHIEVRDRGGTALSDFAVYRPGRPEALTWLDNRRLGYLTSPDADGSRLYVVHDATSGRVLSARGGSDFVWDRGRRHLAFLAGAPGSQVLVVDGQNVWPRAGATRLHGQPVWSQDGRGLAIVDAGGRRPQLVVLVQYDDPNGDLTWPVPAEAVAPGMRVFWANDTRVIIGPSALKPRFAAGWQRLR